MEKVGNQARSVKYDSLNSPGEWAIVFFVMLISFILTWYAIQYVYSPTPRSESPSIITSYKRQGCVQNPDYIPGNLLIWEQDRLKYIPFDSFDHQIVLFCP